MMKYPGLMAINCVISNNIVGTIGYWIGSGSKFANTPPTYNTNNFNSKSTNLTIANNTCYYIATQDHLGKYFVTSERVSGVSTQMCLYPSGFVTIKDNKLSWIHVGIAFEDNSKLSILNNHLNAYNYSYLTPYGEVSGGTTDGEAYGSQFAIFVNANTYTDTPAVDGYGNPLNSNNSNCVITGNIIGAGYWYIPTLNIYKYSRGGIFCKASAIITNNIVKGVSSSSTAARLIAYGGSNMIISHNRLYREDSDISYYIGFAYYESHSWNGSGSFGFITENYLDSPYKSGTNTNVIYAPTDVSARWIVERNINQTVTIECRPMTGLHAQRDYYASTDGFWTSLAGLSASISETVIGVPNYNVVTAAYNHTTAGAGYYGYHITYDLGNIIPIRSKLIEVSFQNESHTYTGSTYHYFAKIILRTEDSSYVSKTQNYSNADTLYTLTLEDNIDFTDVYNKNPSNYLIVMCQIAFESDTANLTGDFYPLNVTYRW